MLKPAYFDNFVVREFACSIRVWKVMGLILRRVMFKKRKLLWYILL